ncbi:proline-rich receptor-like protein kinase PERK9 [Panicum virgatum]|uniref:Uncharacterized protein n=1 Tax=Panicum virgatum TaxID=38727 RepID=A0A8T0WDX6_PANVG|nr:proline-rich receptor-like protein kinase PERK9 [Panicum virgatum]KAG2645398.1 hypothetical protein PVAP13_2KG422081 [Panicum virgatum]
MGLAETDSGPICESICLNRTPPTRAPSPHPPLLSRLPPPLLLDRIHQPPAQRSRLRPAASASPPPHLDLVRPAALLRPHGDAAALFLGVRHAELQRRRPKPLAPRSSAAKRPSATPLPREGDRYTGRPEPRPRPPSEEGPSPTASRSPPGSAGSHAAPRPPRPRPHPSPRPGATSPCTPQPSRSAPSSVDSACPTTLSTDENLRPGTAVVVRTRTTTLKTGEVLVFWLRATIVSPSPTRGGYEVVYGCNWPPGDPYGTVHVPRRHVRMIKLSSSPTTPPLSRSSASLTTATAAAARNKETRPLPRPTTAGKSLRLIRSLLPEMERHARAA